jgi:hypothetical protein
MIAILLLAASLHSPAESHAVELCKPALARKAGGVIDRITVTSATAGKTTVIRGALTVLIGMPPAPAGSASAHHLIRADYHYSCSTRRGRIVRTTLTQP